MACTEEKKTRIETLQDLIRPAELHVDSYNPGNAITTYRFFSEPRSYFVGGGIFDAKGYKEALAFAKGVQLGAFYSQRD